MVPYSNDRPNVTTNTAPAISASPSLNEGQQHAADEFFKFLFTADKEFDIRGAGGVGKTYLMSYLIDQIIPRYEDACKLMGIEAIFKEVSMTATTNKAADVLAKATGRPTSTIFSYARLKPIFDWETKKSKLVRNRDWKPISNTIVFVDECSMVDSVLYFQIHATFDDTCKIVYVGDQNQLPPINERISPVYRQKGMKNVELTQNERSAAQPALLALNQQLRDTVSTGRFLPIKGVPGVIDVLDGDEVEAEVQKLFAQSTFDHRILCYTNAQAIEYNEYIRALRGLPDHITQGEVLVVNYGVEIPKTFISPETEVRILSISQIDKWISPCGLVDLDLQYVDAVTSFGTVITQMPVAVDPTDRSNMIKFLQKKGDWKSKEFLDKKVADLRQRDAGTVHKAQGSTYDTVIVDLDDISKCHNRDMVARMLYVAMSRAKNRIVLHGLLPERYGGVIE